MRYLLAIWDGGGATPPELGVARLLVGRGHDVVAYGDPTTAADVTATGATHLPWPTAPQRVSTAPADDVLKDWECRTPLLEDLGAADPGAFTMPSGDGPLVVVGLSSSFMDQSGLLRRITRALASLPVRGVVTTGPSIDPAEVPAAPNVAVVRSLPHSVIFPQADLVVTHAGHGTLIKAIASGVPTLCIPLGRDQHDNAARAARHGVAQVLSSRADADTIAAAVSTLR